MRQRLARSLALAGLLAGPGPAVAQAPSPAAPAPVVSADAGRRDAPFSGG